MKHTYLQNFIILCIGILPLMASTTMSIDFVNLSPEILKTFFGIIFVIISVIWWTLKYLKTGKVTLSRDKLQIPIYGFLAWCFISLFWVFDKYMALLMLAQFTSYVLIFFLIINIFNTQKVVTSLLKTIILSMTLVSIIGLFQYYFPNIEIIQNLFMQTAKPGATFANKNMASHFMVMTLPLALVFMISSKRKMSVFIYSLCLFIGSWFLIYTVARQAYVAFAVEFIVLVIFILIDYYKNRQLSLLSTIGNKSIKILALSSVVISLALVSNLTNKGWNFDNSVKIDQIKSINVKGSSGRLPGWINTLEIIKDNTIFGVGIGQWQFIYPRYYDVSAKDIIFNERVKLKRLHNDYLEMFTNVGLIGYLFLIWLLFLITKYCLSLLIDTQNKYRYQILGIGMGLIGFSVVAFFSFPIRVYLPAFLVLVYFAIIARSHNNFYSYRYTKIKGSKYIAILVVVFGLFFAHHAYKWTLSEHHKAMSLLELSDEIIQQPVIDSYKVFHSLKAINYNELQQVSYMIIGEVLLNKGSAQKAEPYFKKVVDLSPYNAIALLKLAEIYEKQINIEGDEKIRGELNIKQLKVLEFVLSFDPKNVIALSFLTKNLAINGRKKDAAITYEKLKKSFEYFKNRENFGPYHDNVGFVAISVGDYNYATYIFQHAIQKFPTAENYYKMAVLKFDYEQDYEQGVIFAKKALEIDPLFPSGGKIKALIENYKSSTEQ